MISAAPLIRPITVADRGSEIHLIRRAWEEAYRHIFTREEMDEVFTGRITQQASWTAQRTHQIGKLAAVVDAHLAGVAGMARQDDLFGEVTSLYVLPTQQRHGVGLALWNAALVTFKALRLNGVHVWTLERSDAVLFYQHIGCVCDGRGSYSIGAHVEPALRFTIPFQKEDPCA